MFSLRLFTELCVVSLIGQAVGDCELPPHPTHGSLQPRGGDCGGTDQPRACDGTPGTLVPEHWLLTVRCDPGYQPSDHNAANMPSVCTNGKWSIPQLPACVIPHILTDDRERCAVPNPPPDSLYRMFADECGVESAPPGSAVPDDCILFFTCAPGYARRSGDGDFLIHCSNKTWNPPVPDNLCIISATSSAGSSVDTLHYVGCYDSGNYHHITSVTLTKCVQYCQGLKTRYAAVEASNNVCYCGDDITEDSIQRPSSLCNIPCPDDPLRTCGGDKLMSLYDIQGASVAALDDVHFLVAMFTTTNKFVRLYSGGLSTYEELIEMSNSPGLINSVDYHLSKNLIFAHANDSLYYATFDPRHRTVATARVVKQVSRCRGFAVDWVDDRIYWANCADDGNSIMASQLNGEAYGPVLSKAFNGDVYRMEIDPYMGIVFWITTWMIQSVETSGEGFNPKVIKTEVHLKALALDLRLRRVYYVGYSDQSLYSMDYSGRNELKHFSDPRLIDTPSLSILGDKVFWVHDNDVFTFREKIYEAPLKLTRKEDVKILKILNSTVMHMRVMHPSLQSQPKVDPCLDKGCAHSCVTSGGTTATCECPPGQALNNDGVTCHAGGMSFLSILLIVAVMVTSLVCLGYKYRSLLQSRLLGIPYSRNRGQDGDEELSEGPTVYRTGEDNVNII